PAVATAAFADPLDLGRLEHEHQLARAQVSGVAMQAELLRVEGRTATQQCLRFLVLALPQTGDDHQMVHRILLVAFTRGSLRPAGAASGRTRNKLRASRSAPVEDDEHAQLLVGAEAVVGASL